MLEINFKVIALSALVPLAIGFIWYGKMGFGSAWMKASGVTMDSAKGMNMPLVFGLTYLFSFMASIIMMPIVIHQFGVFSVLAGDPTLMTTGSDTNNYFMDFMAKYGGNFRTFKHGVFHGVILGIFIGMPIMAINAMFERKGFKYIAINSGFWIVCFALMGGIICQFN